MLRHGLALHKREPQDGGNLPSRIPNPSSVLPSSIGPTAVATSDLNGSIVSAASAPALTTVTESKVFPTTVSGVATSYTSGILRTVIDPSEYASITSAEAASSSSTLAHTTSHATSAAATTSAAAHSSSSHSNLSTLIPAIVVPVVVVLLTSLGAFWFYMRRRHRRELQSQPEFVMTGKGEKLSSRSSSGRSTGSNKPNTFEKKSPVVVSKELSSARSPPSTTSEWPSATTGLNRPRTPKEADQAAAKRSLDHQRALTANSPYRNRGPRPDGRPEGRPSQGPRPATAGRPGPPPMRDPAAARSRSNSNPGHRGPPPRSGPSPVSRMAPSPNLRQGPNQGSRQISPSASPRPPPSAFRFRDASPNMGHNNRAQAPAPLDAPPTGAFNGATSISQYSPIVKDPPSIGKVLENKPLPPPVETSVLRSGATSPGRVSPPGHGMSEENLRIARLANSSRLGYTPAEPSPSPKLPPPATRSQLIPRESPLEAQDRFFGETQSMQARSHPPSKHHSKQASIISDGDDYEDIDAKSDVSSLNEFERFDFGDGIASGRGSPAAPSLSYFAAQNSPASERGSALGHHTTLERW